MYSVYALIDPRNYAICYIGITSNVYRRFIQHLYGKGENPAKEAWITELKQVDEMFIMKTLEQVETEGQARQREIHWIHHYRFLNAPLLNQSVPSIRLPTFPRHAGTNAKQAKKDGGKNPRRRSPSVMIRLFETLEQADPGISAANLARLASCDESTVRRYRIAKKAGNK